MAVPTTTKRRTGESEAGRKPDLAWEVEPESVASEAWLLMQQLMFSEGKPRFVRIAFEHGLSPPQAWAIRRLAEPHSMGQLAQVLHCDQSNITGITDRLEERGLVERTPSPGDRRVKLLVLTDKGRSLRAEMLRAVAVPPPALSDLPERDQRALRDLLRRAVEAAEPDSA